MYLVDGSILGDNYCLIYNHLYKILFHYQQQLEIMPNTADLNDMMLFIAVIDAGSFTLAADRLTIPKANLSRKISRLEQRLGVTLLERTTRSQHITEAGQHYLEHCRRIQQEVDLAEAA